MRFLNSTLLGLGALMLGGCAQGEVYPLNFASCETVASAQVVDGGALMYDFSQSSDALAANGIGEFDLSLAEAETQAALGSAVLQVQATGPVVAFNAEPTANAPDAPCADWLEVPVEVSLEAPSGLLNESFQATLRIDEVQGVRLVLRTASDSLMGDLDLAEPFAQSPEPFDRFDLMISLERPLGGAWAGTATSVAVEVDLPEGCPNSDPDVDLDCPSETEHFHPLLHLASS